MSLTEQRLFEKKIAFNSAPALCGIKCACLLSLDSEEFDVRGNADIFNSKAACRGIEMRLMCSCGRRVLIMVFQRGLLRAQLENKRVRALLSGYGYNPALDTDACLDRLSERIKNGGGFPHEIGLFLGYPVDDVLGFIENGGENFKLCGCWKVYSDTESAEKTFRSFERCREYLCSKLNRGLDIYQALGI